MDIQLSSEVKIHIFGVNKIDPINIILEDMGSGKGRVWIECDDDAWVHYWGALGAGEDICSFLINSDTEYLVHKFLNKQAIEIDYYQVASDAGIEEDLTAENISNYEEEISEAYGEDWLTWVPMRKTQEYSHLARIVNVIKLVLADADVTSAYKEKCIR